MSTQLKLWILTLALVATLLPAILGAEAESWFKGEGGAVNLPGAMAPASAEHQSEYILNSEDRYRAGFVLPDISKGLTLNLPSNLPQATVVYQDGAVTISVVQTDGMIRFAGEDLMFLRDRDITNITMLLGNAEGALLRVRIELSIGDESFRVYAQ